MEMAVLIGDSGVSVIDFNVILLYSKSKNNKNMTLFLLTFHCMPTACGFANHLQIMNSINGWIATESVVPIRQPITEVNRHLYCN